MLNAVLLPHADTQSPDVIAYLPVDYNTSCMSLCTGLAVYNQVKKLTTGECTSALGQKFTEGWECSNCILTSRRIHTGSKVCT